MAFKFRYKYTEKHITPSKYWEIRILKRLAIAMMDAKMEKYKAKLFAMKGITPFNMNSRRNETEI